MTITEVCFGTEIHLLAWAEEQNLPLLKKTDGSPDWNAMYDIWLERLDKEDAETGRLPHPDPHYGDEEQMLAWAKEDNLPILKNPEGNYIWDITYEICCRRLEKEENEDSNH